MTFQRPDINVAMFRALFPNAMWWLEEQKKQQGLTIIPMFGYGLILEAAELEYTDHEPLARLLAQAEEKVGYVEGIEEIYKQAVHDMIMHTRPVEQAWVVHLLRMLEREGLMHKMVVEDLIERGWVRRMASVELIAPYLEIRQLLTVPIIKQIFLHHTTQKLLRMVASFPFVKSGITRYLDRRKGH
jgi:hypothetical protein